MKGEVQERGQTVVIASHIWKHTIDGEGWAMSDDDKMDEDTIIGSTTPGSSRRGSHSLPTQCGPENMQGMTSLAMWTTSIAFHYNQAASEENNTSWLRSYTLFV